MSNLQKALESLKTTEELKAYIEAQQNSFIEISVKFKLLSDENERNKKQIEKFQSEKNQQRTNELKADGYSDAEIICITQLELLRLISDERHLTYEEVKKTETLTKVYDQIKKIAKNEDEFKGKTEADLLKLIEGGS